VEFLLNIKFARLAELPEAERVAIMAAERQCAADLVAAGRLVRMWRVPCQHENWGLWSVSDANELHSIVSGLPAYPWMNEIKVIALATHPSDPPQRDMPAPPLPL